MKIVICGAGNVAKFFCHRLSAQQEIEIVQVYARNSESARLIAESYQVPVIQQLADMRTDADAYILAVNDTAITTLGQQLPLAADAIVLHCAGSQPLQATGAGLEQSAVLWPIYSITPQAFDKEAVPLVVDAGPLAIAKAMQMARAISQQVFTANYEQRKYLHLNAVLVNNFVHHLLVVAENICQQEGLDFDILKPIVKQTIERMDSAGFAAAQTGPARRGDAPTMHQHLELMAQKPEWQAMYKVISDSIAMMYGGDGTGR